MRNCSLTTGFVIVVMKTIIEMRLSLNHTLSIVKGIKTRAEVAALVFPAYVCSDKARLSATV